MKLINLISIFKIPPKPPVHTEIEMRGSARKVVSIIGGDEPSLYKGKYLTSEDIEAKKKEFFSKGYSFLPKKYQNSK